MLKVVRVFYMRSVDEKSYKHMVTYLVIWKSFLVDHFTLSCSTLHELAQLFWRKYWGIVVALALVFVLRKLWHVTLPNSKFLDLSNLKAFADNKINVIYKQKFFLEWLENIVGKEENKGLKGSKGLIFLSLLKILTSNFTLSQTSPGFYVSAVQVLWKHCGKRRNCS